MILPRLLNSDQRAIRCKISRTRAVTGKLLMSFFRNDFKGIVIDFLVNKTQSIPATDTDFQYRKYRCFKTTIGRTNRLMPQTCHLATIIFWAAKGYISRRELRERCAVGKIRVQLTLKISSSLAKIYSKYWNNKNKCSCIC